MIRMFGATPALCSIAARHLAPTRTPMSACASLLVLGALAACSPAAPAVEAPSASGSSAATEATGAPSASASPGASSTAAASAKQGSPAATSSAAASASTSATSPASSSSSSSPAAPALPPVTLDQIDAAPAGKPPVLGVVAPAKNLVVPAAKAAAFEVKLSAKDWKPAAGDHLCLFFDKKPCRRVDDPTKPVRLGDLGPLDEGQHVVSLLARRASGEFFRPAGKSVPFASASFFVGKKVTPVHKDGAPMLFYSPVERGPASGGAVVLDFFVANGTLGEGQFVITASVGGPGIESGVGLAVKENKPLRLAAARPGEYLSRLRLLQFIPDLGESKALTTVTYSAKQVPGPFGEIERTFTVTK